MPEMLTYQSALSEISSIRSELNTYREWFGETASSIHSTYTPTPKQEQTFTAFRDAARNFLVTPIANETRYMENTKRYLFDGAGNVKYDTLSGPGDTSFTGYLQNAHRPANSGNLTDADYAVLSHLTYASKFGEGDAYLRASQMEGVTVKEYCQELLRTSGNTMSNVDRSFLEQMASSDRFSGLTIGHNVSNTGAGTAGEHTAVMIFECGDGHAIASVQGTNGTVADWQNNAQFNGSEPIAEEQYVASIINGYAGEYRSIDLTGHSQGGREAVTTAILMSPENQAKIGRVVSNDGPGYSELFQAKYAEQIAQIEGKVTNIRPSNSFVGEILNPVGNVQYVEIISVDEITSSGEQKSVNSHLSTTWMINEDGSYVYADGHDLVSVSTLSELTPAISDVLSVFLTEERTAYYLDEFVKICDDGNGKLSFSALLEPSNWGKLKDLGTEFIKDFDAGLEKVAADQLSDQEYYMMRFCQESYNVLGELDEYLEKVEKVAEVLAAVFPESLVTLYFYEIVKKMRSIVKVMRYVFKAVEYVFKAIAAIRAYKKKKARKNYIAQNESMEVSTAAIRQAADALYAAARYLSMAYADYEKITSNVVSVITEKINNLLGGSKESNERISLAPRWEARQYLWAKGVPNFSHASSNTSKTGDSMNEIAEMSENILEGEKNPIFSVTPRTLGAASARASAQAKMIKGHTDNVFSDVRSLGTVWSGDDYNSLVRYTNDLESKLGDYPQSLEKAFSTLGEIAAAYSKYQEAVIEKFQNVKLDF